MIELNNENYYGPEANWDYMSVSQFKEFIDCPERAMAGLRGEYKRPQSDAMLIGSYVDAWCEGTLDQFSEEHPEIYNSRSKEKVLKSDFKMAEQIINEIQNDEMMMRYLSGRKQVILTAEMYGTPWKIKMDNYVEDEFISDLKIMKSVDDKFWSSELRRYVGFVESFKYNFQMNVYTMVEALATGREWYLPTYLVVATKETPSKRIVLDGFHHDMAYVQDYLSFYMPQILRVKNGEIDPEGCGKCDWCRGNMKTIKMDYHFLIG